MQDLTGSCAILSTIKPSVVASTTLDGYAVDTSGFGEVMVIVDLGAAAAGTTLNVRIQEAGSPVDSWSDVPGAAFAPMTPADVAGGCKIGRLLVSARKQWLRAVAVAAGGAATLSVHFVLAGASVLPVQKGQQFVVET